MERGISVVKSVRTCGILIKERKNPYGRFGGSAFVAVSMLVSADTIIPDGSLLEGKPYLY